MVQARPVVYAKTASYRLSTLDPPNVALRANEEFYIEHKCGAVEDEKDNIIKLHVFHKSTKCTGGKSSICSKRGVCGVWLRTHSVNYKEHVQYHD